MLSSYVPMRLLRITEPFDHPEFVYEPKIDGFRALAHVRGAVRSYPANGYTFKSWPQLAEEIAHAVRAKDAYWTGRSAAWSRTTGATSTSCCFGATGLTITPSIS